MIVVGVKDLRRRGAPTFDVIERKAKIRVGYQSVTYKRCEYRVQWPNGKPFIDIAEPIRCRGESWEKPKGRQRREACADYKRKFKFSRMGNRRRDAAWWLSRARWLKCPWRTELRRRRRDRS